MKDQGKAFQAIAYLQPKPRTSSSLSFRVCTRLLYPHETSILPVAIVIYNSCQSTTIYIVLSTNQG